MAEVVKCGVIADRALFHLVESKPGRIAKRSPDVMARIIEACCRIKLKVVSGDPRESNRRKILNFGHTIGHAIETLAGYRMAHGEAIAVGMVAEARLASRVGLLSAQATRRIGDLLALLGLPTTLPAGMQAPAILEVAHRDKKARAGKVTYALPLRIGAMANVDGDYGIAIDDRIAAEILGGMCGPQGTAQSRVQRIGSGRL
jgi:3-dehydroquinate synthase